MELGRIERRKSLSASVFALLGVCLLVLVCGCGSPVRLVEPSWEAQEVRRGPANIRMEPLAYMLSKRWNKVNVRIFNLSDEDVHLRPETSHVIDPWNRVAPVREVVIRRHGSTTITLPPKDNYRVWEPFSVTPGMDTRKPIPVYYPELGNGEWPTYTIEVRQTDVKSDYQWKWPAGRIKLHLDYDSAGRRFTHDLVFEK